MKEPPSQVQAGFRESSREWYQQHQEAIIISKLKGQVKGYQNPERSVTVAGWHRGPLNRSCDLLTEHKIALATKIQQEETGSSRPPAVVPLVKVNQKQKATAQLQSTALASQSIAQAGEWFQKSKRRMYNTERYSKRPLPSKIQDIKRFCQFHLNLPGITRYLQKSHTHRYLLGFPLPCTELRQRKKKEKILRVLLG